MGAALAGLGLLFVVGGLVATGRGEGVDNLLNVVAGLIFAVAGADMWWAHVSVTSAGIRVHRVLRGLSLARDEISGLAVGPAVGMMVAGQRTLVVETTERSIPLNVLARYRSSSSEDLLRQQRDDIARVLHVWGN